MSISRGVRTCLLLSVLVLLQACTPLAYNVGPLQAPRNMHMSAAGTPGGGDGAHKSAVEPMTTRLQALQKMATASLFPAAVLGGLAFPEEARAGKGGGVAEASKEWISGKGAQPKGSDDKTGTRKETKYLRCLSNCLADCQKPTYGPEKDREECLQLCQDECCTSYEQCTYTVTQNK